MLRVLGAHTRNLGRRLHERWRLLRARHPWVPSTLARAALVGGGTAALAWKAGKLGQQAKGALRAARDIGRGGVRVVAREHALFPVPARRGLRAAESVRHAWQGLYQEGRAAALAPAKKLGHRAYRFHYGAKMLGAPGAVWVAAPGVFHHGERRRRLKAAATPHTPIPVLTRRHGQIVGRRML